MILGVAIIWPIVAIATADINSIAITACFAAMTILSGMCILISLRISFKKNIHHSVKEAWKMEQKDHKAIAEILKRNYNVYPSDKLISELADYFEKEDLGELDIYNPKPGVIYKVFNREQFFKDCGCKGGVKDEWRKNTLWERTWYNFIS